MTGGKSERDPRLSSEFWRKKRLKNKIIMGKFVKIPIHEPRMKSRRRARKVTTQFHKLTHEIDRLKQNDQVEEEEKKKKIVELKDKIEALGGRKAYQDASILSTSFHRTSKWVFQKLTQFQRRPSKGESKLRLLEVSLTIFSRSNILIHLVRLVPSTPNYSRVHG